jgi:hypothetical protein
VLPVRHQTAQVAGGRIAGGAIQGRQRLEPRDAGVRGGFVATSGRMPKR